MVSCANLSRPEARNAVDPSTAEELAAAFDRFNNDTQAKVRVHTAPADGQI